MRPSTRIWLTVLIMICLSTSTTPAQQRPSVAQLKEQIKQLENVVLAQESTDSLSTSNLKLLTAKRMRLRASLQHQLDSLRRYRLSYGHRFLVRESAAVNELIRSLEMDLRSLEGAARSTEAAMSPPVEYSHAPKSSQTLAAIATAFPPEDDPTPTPTPTPDPEIEKANKEKAIAEASKAASDARKAASDAETAAIAAKLAALRAKLGLSPTDAGPTATPPSGNITAGEAPKFIETQILAETGGRMATAQLLRQLCGIDGAPEVPALKKQAITSLVINNSIDKAAVSKYRMTVAQLQFLHDHYLKLIEQSANERDDTKATAAFLPLLIPAATQIVKNVADLINLFRTDTQFNAQTVTVDNRMIVSNLANRLLATNTEQCKVTAIYQPAVYPLTVPKEVKGGSLLAAYKQLLDDVTAGETETNKNVEKVAELTKQKAELEALVTKLEAQIAEQKEKDAQKEQPQKKPSKKKKKPAQPESPFDIAAAEKKVKQAQKFIGKLDERIARLNQAAANLTSFKASLAGLFQILTAVDDATKQPLLNGLINAERLSEILAEAGTYVLDLNVKASGTNRTRRNMFFNTKLAHSGGVSIDANLFNNQDQLVFGRIEDFYIEFTGSKDIRQRSGFKRLDELKR